MTKRAYTVAPVEDSGQFVDVRILIDGKVWHLWGRKGAEREEALASASDGVRGKLPVVFGAGLGVCIEKLLERGPVAVVDSDPQIAALTGADCFRDHPQVLWLDGEPAEVLGKLGKWQKDNGEGSFDLIKMPLYLRLDPDWYVPIANTLEAAEKADATPDFWQEVKYPKFQNVKPKVLFFNRPYFLTGEIISALDRLGISYRSVDIGMGDTVRDGFVEDLLKAVVEFKPDFALTVNHFGVDREGKLTDLLLKLKLPLASWFVDNPHLVLYRYENVSSELTSIFTYDAGNLSVMRDKGFDNVFYLPLATDPCRFKAGKAGKDLWRSKVSFVGNSMIDAVSSSLADANLPTNLRDRYPQLAAEFGNADDLSVEKYLKKRYPELLEIVEEFPADEQKLSFEALITWEATRQYRLSCIEAILDFNPLIVGDSGWHVLLDKNGWRYLPSLDYYADLPAFYPMSDVSFNCTSRQMKGAVNQRIFDVPACGGFILTDYREQMENLFEPDSEIISYSNVKEIPQIMERCLGDKKMREKVSAAARKRILSEHTYEHRLLSLLDKMRKTFG
ncbi:spore maturation protein CgeB [Maridesulfovibrio ferrireducens]|uniref:Spore maturation protein CgeB n=1 Tax=Maridesulfovibrio ferrireducens TaxID=246191 RepID=A0A1G9E9X4_9BACT|nr:glycosyltransferase [Maridesulfovibrio ferrireducens]SDK72878.1 spore maturation protein CgeB [Maridesulfovibrio ferrireducens]